MKFPFKVCHITSVHYRYDTRIFVKQCASLANTGVHVSLIVADGRGDEIRAGVNIQDVGKNGGGRLARATRTAWQILGKAFAEKADIYHFHDPELIPVGLLLRANGKEVVYDVHEDTPRQILRKHYLPPVIRPLFARCSAMIENYAARHFSAICAATPYIRDRFLRLNNSSADINNFPLLEEMDFHNTRWSDRQDKICYVGAITENRGIVELIDAMNDIEARLDLAGDFVPSSLRDKLLMKPGWAKVNELGFIERPQVKEVLSTSKVGIVTIHPLIDYLDSLPVKMFEYMAASIPLVASDFPFWKDIAEGNNCGFCVDPLNPLAIAKSVNMLLSNDNLALTMGRNGRKAVENLFNWENEEKKLAELYLGITSLSC